MAKTPLTLPFSGEKLREHRERRGMYQTILSVKCANAGQPVSRELISRLENNVVKPSPPVLGVLVKVLDVEVDDLLVDSDGEAA